jgi:hypothetical protein
MKKLGFLLFLVLMLGIASGTMMAQNVGDNSVYFTTYYANNVVTAAVPDQTLRIVNDGDSTVNPEGTLYASIYVFDDSQELTECCSCAITADGLLSESVKNQLTTSPITGIKPPRGVIKVISSSTEADVTTNFAPNTPVAGLRGWATHTQSVANKYPYGAAPWYVTETPLADSNLGATEKSMLENLCYFDKLLSGHPCPCTPEDFDF